LCKENGKHVIVRVHLSVSLTIKRPREGDHIMSPWHLNGEYNEQKHLRV